MVRALAPSTRPSPPVAALKEREYDLFVWTDDSKGFLLRRTRDEPLGWSDGTHGKQPMERLAATLSRMRGSTVIWWPKPGVPSRDVIGMVQEACRKAKVSLILHPELKAATHD
jgi:hypothetical protein